jgi:diamine N-acetyltransferase
MDVKLIPIISWKDSTFADLYVDWANDSEVTEHLYQGSFPISYKEALDLYDSFKNHNNVVFYIVVHDRNSDKTVGTVGLYDIHWPSRIGEFRVMIGRKHYWGKGIGRICLEKMMKLAFEQYNFHKFWLGFNANNKRAENSYSKSGLKHECTLKEHHYKNGVYNDIVRMYMLENDYRVWRDSKQV